MAKIEIDKERCKACGMCIAVCPKGIIALSEGLNHTGSHYAKQTDREKCTGCRQCGLICPDSAISVYR